MKTMNNQQGFTLIELMIALVLGLIVIAAVVQVYIMSTRTAIVQQAGSNILDANVFGLQHIESNLRLAGLDLSEISSGTTNLSGIVMSIENLKGVQGMNANLVTRTATDLPTNTNRASGSSQLTIQYRAPVDMNDCEGKLVLGEKTAKIYEIEDGNKQVLDKFSPVKGQLVVERYFLKDVDGDGVLELRCDAGTYETVLIEQYEHPLTPEQTAAATRRNTGVNRSTGVGILQGIGDDGAMVANHIDDFKVQLAIKDGDNIRYVSPTEYTTSHNDKAIVAVKAAILAKGSVASITANDMPKNPTFYMLGETVGLKSTANQNYIRRVYESNSMLRNSRDTN